MSSKIGEDLTEMKKKLSEYVDKGRVVGYHEVREEPVIAEKPDRSKIKPLKKMNNYEGHFLAVDCSTRTLKRAHNWGIYLLRPSFALVKAREVEWGYEERIFTAKGDAFSRGNQLADARLELESEVALKQVCREDEGDYLLLDGPSYFGGPRKFRLWLYEECEKRGINLLCISKQSSTLHDEKGRDFIASVYYLSPYTIWMYFPVKESDKHRNLYGNVSVVKLCQDSPRVFRCDIMEYLSDRSEDDVVSPLTFLSDDPRCVGYPVTLWLAHDFSTPSNSKLLHYYDLVEEALANAGLLDVLRLEELSCNFPDELHGVKHPFRWEWIEHV